MSAADTANFPQAVILQPARQVAALPRANRKMSRTRYPLAIVLAAVCVGIVADRQAWPLVPRSMPLWWCVSAAALGSWYALWRNHKLRPAMIALGVALAAAGGAWHHARWNLFGDDDLGRFALASKPPICLEAVALSAPRRFPRPPSRRYSPCGRRSNGDSWSSPLRSATATFGALLREEHR